MEKLKKKYILTAAALVIIVCAVLFGFKVFKNFSIADAVTNALEKHSFLAVFLAFIGGVAVSFTPCVFPLVPITIAYIGGRDVSSRFQGFLISLFYVLGLAVVYTILGIISAVFRIFFGSISANPITNFVVGIIFVVLGLYMMDLFIIPLPSFMQRGIGSEKAGRYRGTYFGAFFIGAVSGLVVGSCTFPVLFALLTYVASGKVGLVYGALLLFSYAMGMGMIFIVAGTFSGFFAVLFSKKGIWMTIIKKLLAGIIVVMGLYYFYTAIKLLR